MDLTCLVLTVQAGEGGVIVGGIFIANELSVLQWSLWSPDLNAVEHLLDVVEPETSARIL